MLVRQRAHVHTPTPFPHSQTHPKNSTPIPPNHSLEAHPLAFNYINKTTNMYSAKSRFVNQKWNKLEMSYYDKGV